MLSSARGVMEKKLKHLEFIQASITRLAGNTFILKGWCITLIAALFALSAKDSDKIYALLAYYPVIIFWILDGYFLAVERRFRALYDRVRTVTEEEIDFSMDTRDFADEYCNTWAGAALSRTLIVYYGALAFLMLLVLLIIL